MKLPNTRERKALKHLSYEEWDDVASICPGEVGSGTITGLLEKGWIERAPDCPPGRNRVRITNAGRAALDQPIAKSTSSKPKLKTLPPRLKPLEPRLKPPKR
jgi:hypothetical protein